MLPRRGNSPAAAAPRVGFGRYSCCMIEYPIIACGCGYARSGIKNKKKGGSARQLCPAGAPDKMIRLFLSTWLVCILVVFTPARAAEENAAPQAEPAAAESSEPERDANGFYIGGPVYVSDNNQIWTRSGPGTNYRITGARSIGTKLTLLAYSKDGSFSQVQDEDGNTFWIGTKTLQAESCGRPRIEELSARIAELEQELANYDSKLSRQVQTLTQRNSRLEKENEGMKTAIAQKDHTIDQLDELRRDYEDKLQTRELDMQMRWWLQGAGIALGGAIVGMIFIYLPKPGRNRNKRRRY